MPGNKRVLYDSDALVALFNENDALHQRAKHCLKVLLGERAEIVSVYAVVLEAATALAKDKQIKRPDLAMKLLDVFSKLGLPGDFDDNVSELVAKIYKPTVSRKNSPFDHYVLALAQKNDIKEIFSFDSFYTKRGLKLVSG